MVLLHITRTAKITLPRLQRFEIKLQFVKLPMLLYFVQIHSNPVTFRDIHGLSTVVFLNLCQDGQVISQQRPAAQVLVQGHLLVW